MMSFSFVARPFTAVALGYCLVVSDWQAPWLPSLLGWTLAFVGLARVARRLPTFAPAAAAALTAGLLLTRLYPLTFSHVYLLPAYFAAEAVAICATAAAILAHGRRTGDRTTARVFSLIMVALVIAELGYLAGQILMVQAASRGPLGNAISVFHDVAQPARVAQLAATIGFCVALMACRKQLRHLGQA